MDTGVTTVPEASGGDDKRSQEEVLDSSAVVVVGDGQEIDAIFVFKTLQCEKKGCTNVPSLGYEGEKLPTRCSEHMEEAMLELISLHCDSQAPERCNGKRTFGFNGGAATRCIKHQQDGMIDLLQRRNQVCNVFFFVTSSPVVEATTRREKMCWRFASLVLIEMG